MVERLRGHFIEDWSQFFKSCNWYNFRFAHIEIEDDHMMGDFEIIFVILGLGFTLIYNYNPNTETRYTIKRRVEEITAREVAYDEEEG